VRPYVIADVFTDRPLEGNPVAVFTDGDGLSDGVMQRTARELNLSETVFLQPAQNDEADVRARIFTPAAELPFAGHPVLGTAFVLGEERPARASVIRLETGVGVIPIALTRDGGGDGDESRVIYGEMDQRTPTFEPFDRADELLAALGVERSLLPIQLCRNGPEFVYVALESEAAVAAVAPDMRALAGFGGLGTNCFAVAAAAARTVIKTRMFAPGLGVAEDPATGSAAGPLALHLVRHGWSEFGAQIEIRQGAEIGRPSVIHARVEGSPDRVTRIAVGGSAVIVARGEYRLQ
jgi:trans-2,3-dihydro-3-hydroxyanthranilate isomerase